jgi:hypothetical protein
MVSSESGFRAQQGVDVRDNRLEDGRSFLSSLSSANRARRPATENRGCRLADTVAAQHKRAARRANARSSSTVDLPTPLSPPTSRNSLPVDGVGGFRQLFEFVVASDEARRP